ncbi:LacI family transcriptional regulator [Glutamicibacter sp. JL.03c]|uniref:LacI family DNA-binding transcriptional regulator n=1 Tax=Glutamicibacter sp. JL.03c TaxID=2984842 RepID=UPI0021F7F839|nr:LacI family DNA-binding transcriptional regulator [Glutamicibacter sp. JL.03c]UYQ77525.1 LacI family transcriptional regulator [Glutamicibacter sp. JL.03c]
MPTTSAPRPAKRPTLADVARASGVSVALASIVLRGAEGASEESRARVKQAAADLGYRPDSRARSLRSRRSRTLGLALALGEPLHAELADALFAQADAKGFEIILGATGRHRDERRVLNTLIDAGVEAVIGIFPELPATQLNGVAKQLPVISLLREVEGLPSIITDEAAGIEQLVNHLVQLGHTRLLHLDGGSAVAAQQRREAFRVAAERAQAAAEILAAGADDATAFEVLRGYLETTSPAQRATAVLAFNDRAALGARRALDLCNLGVPGQMSLTGYDDSEFARLAQADLTSVRQDVNALAEAAMQAALQATGASSIHAPHLVVRGSTAEYIG